MKTNMKAKIYTLSVVLFLFTACDDALDVEPHSFSGGENYYETEGQILTAVNGAYGQLQGLYAGNVGEGYAFAAMTEMRSDNTTYTFNEADRGAQQREEIDEFLINSTNNYVQQVWSMLYAGIQQSNIILNRIEDVEFSDQAKKDQYIGEVKFLRALNYFHLVRLFGPVPLKVDEVQGPEEAFTAERASVDEVYEQIMQDARDAVAALPESYPSSEAGRATKGAALTLLGDVHLTRKEYTEAVTALQQVTTFGYALVEDYASVFDPTNKNNAESVFEIQYSAEVEGENSSFIWGYGPTFAGVDLTGFQGNLGGTNIPTPDIVEAYEEGDEREDASVAYHHNTGNTTWYQEAFGDSIPFVNKFYHPPFQLQGRTDENFPVYRYAHVLLMLAEALNEVGETGQAMEYTNTVRRRAGLEDLSGLTQDAFREAVYNEQRVELAFEGHRWYNLLRTDRAIEVMTEHGQREKQRLSRLSNASFDVQPHKLLFPIPQREIRLNGFDQNPGW